MRSIWWLPRTEIHGHPFAALRVSFSVLCLKCAVCSNIAKTKSDHDVDSTIPRLHLYPLPWAITTLINDLPQKELTFHHISLNMKRDSVGTQKIRVLKNSTRVHICSIFRLLERTFTRRLKGQTAWNTRQSSVKSRQTFHSLWENRDV